MLKPSPILFDLVVKRGPQIFSIFSSGMPIPVSLKKIFTCLVEVELKKATATVQINSLTREIKEYSIESKAEETTSFLPVNFKSILIMVAVSAATYIALSFLNIQSFF